MFKTLILITPQILNTKLPMDFALVFFPQFCCYYDGFYNIKRQQNLSFQSSDLVIISSILDEEKLITYTGITTSLNIKEYCGDIYQYLSVFLWQQYPSNITTS